MFDISNNNEKECYWCGAPATSKEHIPPKCLFPEDKDIRKIYDEDFRKDLITVPSCDEHNNQKSGDDEILLACLSCVFGANGIAFVHSHTKLSRTFSRNPSLITSAFKILKEDTLKIEEHSFPVAIAEVNNIKMLRAFEGIARGLYLHEFGKRFIGKCNIIPTFVKYRETSPERELLNGLIKIVLEREQFSWDLKGSNPQIFTYRMGPVDPFGIRPMILTFYKTLNVFVSYVPDGHTFHLDSNIETLYNIAQD